MGKAKRGRAGQWTRAGKSACVCQFDYLQSLSLSPLSSLISPIRDKRIDRIPPHHSYPAFPSVASTPISISTSASTSTSRSLSLIPAPSADKPRVPPSSPRAFLRLISILRKRHSPLFFIFLILDVFLPCRRRSFFSSFFPFF